MAWKNELSYSYSNELDSGCDLNVIIKMTYYVPGLVHYRGLCNPLTMDYNVGFIHQSPHRQHLFVLSATMFVVHQIAALYYDS